MFEETSSQSSNIVPPTISTERSKGLFIDEQAKTLTEFYQDMIDGAPISKPVIITRLEKEHMGKTLFN